jgi:hypothetical protein
MCSCADWENFMRRFEAAVEDEQTRELLSNVAARIDALIDSVMARACVPDDPDWVRTRAQRKWVV